MKRLTLLGLALLVSAPLSTLAAEKTVVLSVKNADCVLCPPIVKQSLAQVPGVKTVDIKQAGQTASVMATIIFDDGLASAAALIAATTKAGYPSSVVQ